MHPLNLYNNNKPDFIKLASRYTEFKQYVTLSSTGYPSIDFKDVNALRCLTKCLLKEDFGYQVDLPDNRLCPTRTDLEPYLGPSTSRRVLDIGTGAVAIYPLLLHNLRPGYSIVGTEIDDKSYHHALSVLETNSIAPSSISIAKPGPTDRILFPLFQDGSEEDDWAFTICNPPFFGSEEEMIRGQAIKQDSAHAAPTAASNELITPGGEVSFITQMIDESLLLLEKCRWYTSLVGKYSSLSPVVEHLRRHKIDNYFIKSIQQAKTSRWVVGWSHSAVRLPDSLTRENDDSVPASFAKLQPRSNTYSHTFPLFTKEDVEESIKTVLASIHMSYETDSDGAEAREGEGVEKGEGKQRGKGGEGILFSPRVITWSRAARRKALLNPGTVIAPSKEGEPIFQVGLRIYDTGSGETTSEGAGVGDLEKDKERERGTTVELAWLYGKDRVVVEGFWMFLLNKVGGGGGRGAGVQKRKIEDDEASEQSAKR